MKLKKKSRKSRKWFKTKQIAIKRMRTKFDKKNNQMIKDKIKNKIKFEIINVIKTIVIRWKETE
jgi:hypothetical protein